MQQLMVVTVPPYLGFTALWALPNARVGCSSTEANDDSPPCRRGSRVLSRVDDPHVVAVDVGRIIMTIRPIPGLDAVVLEIYSASGLRLFRVIEHWDNLLLQASLAEWIDRDARFLVHCAYVY